MRRGLAIMGGGAKGAYSCGAMGALRDRGYRFEVVAGTSAGALNAAIWATRDIDEGTALWRVMSPENSYERSPRLKSLPRPLARLLGSVVVMISLLASALTGSPVNGKFESGVRRAIFILLYVAAGLISVLAEYQDNNLSIESLAIITIMSLIVAWTVYVTFFYGNDSDFAKERQFESVKIFFGLIMLVVATMIVVRVFGSRPEASEVWLAIFLQFGGAIAVFYIISWAFAALSRARVLRSAGLRATLQVFLQHRQLEVPTYVTLASSAYVFDPDKPSWAQTPSIKGLEPRRYDPWDPVAKLRWLPRYERIDQLPIEEAIERIMASSALPFGIVEGIQMNGTLYVDGGVIDNVPIVPLLGYNLDEIVVLHLDPPKRRSSEDNGHQQRCADLMRLLTLEDRHLPPRTHIFPEIGQVEPPVTVPRPDLAPFPQICILGPERSLGGLCSGLLNFSPLYANEMISLGYEDTIRQLDKLMGLAVVPDNNELFH